MVPGGVGYKLGKQLWATGEARDNRNWQQGQPHAGKNIDSSIWEETQLLSQFRLLNGSIWKGFASRDQLANPRDIILLLQPG